MNNALTLSNKGTIELEDMTQQVDMMKMLDPKERRYVQRISDDVTKLTVADEALAKEEKRIQRKIQQSADGMRLAEIKRKKKLIRSDRSDKVQRATGVMEAAYEEFMPGRSLGEKIASQIPDRPLTLKAARKGGKK
jgi:hypothetical protein